MKMNKLILKAVATGIITLTILAQITPNPTYANTQPTDISGHWSESFVTSLVNQGVISGYPDGTFKPDKAISSSEFLSLILKAIGETPSAAQSGEAWDAPIIKLAIEKGIIKSDDTFALTNQELTREETAYILYNTLSQKESFKYDQCYTPILDQVIFDHGTISAKYRDAVYSMLQKGVLTGNQNYFYPSQNFNRGGACVVIERVMDKEKRANPDDVTKNGYVVFVTTVEPKESTTARTVPFENGKPVIDNETVLKELKQYPYNSFSGRLADYYDYEGYINSTWKNPKYKTVESKREIVDEYYNVAVESLKVAHNYSYNGDLVKYEKDLKYYKVNDYRASEWIDARINEIKEKSLDMESYFITDKSLFYCASDGTNRTRGRLYFVFHSPSHDMTMHGQKLKADQWYYMDFEVETATSIGQGSIVWERSDVTLGGTVYLSNIIPINPSN